MDDPRRGGTSRTRNDDLFYFKGWGHDASFVGDLSVESWGLQLRLLVED